MNDEKIIQLAKRIEDELDEGPMLYEREMSPREALLKWVCVAIYADQKAGQWIALEGIKVAVKRMLKELES